jgi:type II secretory pathway pseudopilin PulG
MKSHAQKALHPSAPQHPERRSQRAFTRTDLLVVIGVIGLLTTLQLSGLSLHSRQGQTLSCRNNARQE